ncbi:MAG: hypothetical protein L6R41_005504 [Letrouitia leprolyta]|nr:MAG: hypothetical protein L6R41_005504 [Letrouitia leprolyta]
MPSQAGLRQSHPSPQHYASRPITTSLPHLRPPTSSSAPATTNRGPTSTEDTQTDFSIMNVLSNTPAPTTSIDACLPHGFHLDNGVKISGGSGCLLLSGEAFGWKPWEAEGGPQNSQGKKQMLNSKGQWEVGEQAWGLLRVVWPKPDLLILGVGAKMVPISERVRRCINELGVRVEVGDTRNAAAQFNLLATERGTGEVAAALVPIGWREPAG